MLSFISRHLDFPCDDSDNDKNDGDDSDGDSDSNNNKNNKNNDNKNNNSNLYQNVVYVRSYAECAGVLAAHKAGILLSSITSIVHKIPVTRL